MDPEAPRRRAHPLRARVWPRPCAARCSLPLPRHPCRRPALACRGRLAHCRQHGCTPTAAHCAGRRAPPAAAALTPKVTRLCASALLLMAGRRSGRLDTCFSSAASAAPAWKPLAAPHNFCHTVRAPSFPAPRPPLVSTALASYQERLRCFCLRPTERRATHAPHPTTTSSAAKHHATGQLPSLAGPTHARHPLSGFGGPRETLLPLPAPLLPACTAGGRARGRAPAHVPYTPLRRVHHLILSRTAPPSVRTCHTHCN